MSSLLSRMDDVPSVALDQVDAIVRRVRGIYGFMLITIIRPDAFEVFSVDRVTSVLGSWGMTPSASATP
jgi:hypothetical protein